MFSAHSLFQSACSSVHVDKDALIWPLSRVWGLSAKNNANAEVVMQHWPDAGPTYRAVLQDMLALQETLAKLGVNAGKNKAFASLEEAHNNEMNRALGHLCPHIG